MGMAPVTHVLFTRSVNVILFSFSQFYTFIDFLGTRFFNANPKNSKWFNRDRFVLSNGYVLLSHS